MHILMNSKPSPIYAILLVALLWCKGASTVAGCIESERNALLDFKRGLRDHTGRLSSWNGNVDCCNWRGVACSNRTGHVVRLDLRNPYPFSDKTDDQPYMWWLTVGGQPKPYNKWSMGGELRPSLLGLKKLRYLDLSMNNFGGRPIPEFIGSIRNLRYLNLSQAGLGGLVPRQIGNLSCLQYLDLYNAPYPQVHEFSIDDPLWISGLSSLQHLNMNSVKFRDTSSLVQSLNVLPHIVEVQLSECEIQSIPLSLPHVNFTRLSTLDLSWNGINSTIPSWLFNVSSLVHLYLSGNEFRGSIPADIENLSSLNVLDLSYNYNLQGVIPKEVGNICKLQTLTLADMNISRSQPELGDVFSGCIKTSLENLELSGSGLTSYLPDWLGELTSLKYLDLGGNSLVGSLPESLGELTSLRYLELGRNSLVGSLPESLGELTSLKYLDLRGNSLVGSLPESIGRLTSLQELDLSDNKLNGTVPESLGGLVELVYLDLSMNLLEGIISEAHLGNLTKLSYLDLSSNPRLALKFSPNWVPLFRLHSLNVSSCSLGKKFPSWIRNQANISLLFMANAGIEDAMPDWFWVLVVQVIWLDVSKNAISGRLPNFSNDFYGSLSIYSRKVEILDLSDNLFTGMIDPAIGESMPNLSVLQLSGNKLHGDVPSSLCRPQHAESINLARNLLSGELPNCWNHIPKESLIVLDFSSNNLSGGVPDTISSLSSLEVLQLSNNSPSGEIPSSLQGCTGLAVLDLSQNKFTGKVPTWIGESCPSLKILQLRSNMFSGRIPRNLPRLLGLQIVDLAHNNLSGTIPKSFGKFAVMKVSSKAYIEFEDIGDSFNYIESMEVVTKGRPLTYVDSNGILSLVTDLDLSGNNLYGTIPPQLGSLRGLVSLNLSGNHLNGEIPKEVGLMQSLESLDLSGNELSGAIPSTMASLTFLGSLDLSNNNLSGRIPSGNQLETFNESTYIGNPGLCGFPLKQICEDDNGAETRNSTSSEDDDGAGSEMLWCYLGAAPGFVVGFWLFWGTLILKRNWKDAYIRYVDRQYDWLYVIVAVSFNRFKNRYV